MQEVNVGALVRLSNAKHLLKLSQYRAIRRQIIAGDPHGAMKELQKILLSQGTNAVKNKK